MSFNDKYKEIRLLAKKEISVIEEKMVSSIQVREPLKSYIIEFLMSPSKRIRPFLAIIYMKACGYELTEEQLELLTTIELVHNASLIHDDIIDESKFRRGHKTISENFDNKLGVISGDYILSVAMEKIADLGSIEILRKFSDTLKQMCIGEINQNFDRFKIGTIEDYIEKSKNKTAYLFETALICTALLCKDKLDLKKISDFALNVGIAFQIRDDLMNFTKNEPSKPFNNDVADGIYTAPIIYAGSVEGYRSGIEKTKTLLNNYVNSAISDIELLPNNEFKTALREFLELLNND